MSFKNFRKGLNNSVKEWGNRRTPRLTKGLGKGLGDLLTMDVNFRRAGVIAGLALPGTACYLINSYVSPNTPAGNIMTAVGINIFYPLPVLTSTIGYCAGEYLDRLRGDKSKRSFPSSLPH